MDDSLYDSLDEDTFLECYSDIGDHEDTNTTISSKEHTDDLKRDNLSEIIPLYQRETRKTTMRSLKKDGRSKTEIKKTFYREPLPVKQKKENKTYLNLFYSKIKYPAIGGGDVGSCKTGSETTRAQYDPSSRISSAVSQGKCESFFEDKEYSSDESSFYGKFIAEEELKRNRQVFDSPSETMSNLLSVSEQCWSNTQLNKPKQRRKESSKASSVPSRSLFSGTAESNLKLQLLRKRQYYGKKVSSRNKAIMEETKLIKNFNTKLKLKN